MIAGLFALKTVGVLHTETQGLFSLEQAMFDTKYASSILETLVQNQTFLHLALRPNNGEYVKSWRIISFYIYHLKR